MNKIVHDCTFENCPNWMLPQKIANSLLLVFVFIVYRETKTKPHCVKWQSTQWTKKNSKNSFTKDTSLLCSRYLSCHAMLCDNQMCHAMLCDHSGPEFWNLTSVTETEIFENAQTANQRNLKKPALRGHHSHVISLHEFPSNTNAKWPAIVGFPNISGVVQTGPQDTTRIATIKPKHPELSIGSEMFQSRSNYLFYGLS